MFLKAWAITPRKLDSKWFTSIQGNTWQHKRAYKAP